MDIAESPLDVLIIGAGPVGLTLACELRRRGVRLRIIDAEAGPTPVDQSRALGIHARTLEMLEGVGVTNDLVARGRRVHAINAWDHGRMFLRFQPEFDRLKTPYPFVLSLSQGETERRLEKKLAEYGVGVEWNARLTQLDHSPGGVAAKVCGPDGAEADVHAAYLVGCDGAHSTVRHQLNLGFEGHPYEERFLLADLRLRWPLAQDEAHLLLTDRGPVAAIPLPEPDCWRLIDATGASEDDAPDAVAARFGDLLHKAALEDASIEGAMWASAFRIHRRATDRLRVGRCFLAGDAAHIHSPVGGQGMNIGIQDACNLAWKLALVIAGVAPESLLDSYEQERLPVARSTLRGTHWATRLVVLRNPLARAIRNRLASWLTKPALVRRRLTRELSELGVHYRGSPVVAEDRTGAWAGPRPGERIPDVDLASPTGAVRLFDLLRGTKHVLLCFEESRERLEPIATAVRDRWKDLIDLYVVVRNGGPAIDGAAGLLQDASGELHGRFHAESPCLYLIRPDGYLGYRARPPDAAAFERYLTKVVGS
ncbi:MAG: FAD-dependent monooxygenase [Planctomycetes bacterium]|nr:FAD-dependent monooxygenase [Planctomycetota bacterium]